MQAAAHEGRLVAKPGVAVITPKALSAGVLVSDRALDALNEVLSRPAWS